MEPQPAPDRRELGALAPGASAPKRGYLGFALRAAAGLAVVAFLLWRYDARPVLRALRREPPGWFGAALAVYLLGQALSAWRWQLLAALVRVRGRYREFLRLYYLNMFINVFVPGVLYSQLGGDAARAIYLGRERGQLGEAAASVAADRGIGLFALFWFAALMALLLRAEVPAAVVWPTVVVGVATFAAYLAGPWLARLVPRLPHRVERVAALVVPYLDRPAALIPAAALSILLQVLLSIEQWLLARGLGLGTPLAPFLLYVPIANVFASLPLTFSGLGIRETVYLVLLSSAGIGHDDAIALGLLWFAVTMVGGLTGVVAFLTSPLPEAGRQVA
ncbi:MAG TPA: lysylphosphatidylglycerol synthase transmembrane domain-containing protein [Candidatus Binataceae bacterium]|nr:lysylphosphatidylglycerol synthase transmembrane domain-containing protein [Candidatus Binataceae bacterium]